MFSKAIVLLLVAASAIAGSINPGIYRITNVASHSTVRTFEIGNPNFVSSDLSNPGPFELWNVRDAEDGGYTIQNVGLRAFAAVRAPVDGAPVITSSSPTVFNIESAGNGEFVIKLPFDDLLWNVEPPVVPRGYVALRRANGRSTERWVFTSLQLEDSSYSSKSSLTGLVKQFIGGFLYRI